VFFTTLRNAWKVPELRKKLIYTVMIILIFRVGCYITVPFLEPGAVKDMFAAAGGTFLDYLDTLSGGALSTGSLFALSIQPYINASIIMQLLTYAIPVLESMQKEGEEGRKKIQKITGFVAFGISVVMSYAYYITQRNAGAVLYTPARDGAAGWFAGVVIVATFTAGAMLVVWLGNTVNRKGIGNGVSIRLFAGIVARGPEAIYSMLTLAFTTPEKYAFIVPLILVVFVIMIGFIVFMNESERRIPIQYAKRVVGRKQYGGQSTHIPIKIAMSGVMPIIFAMAIMSLPSTLSMFNEPPTLVTVEDNVYATDESGAKTDEVVSVEKTIRVVNKDGETGDKATLLQRFYVSFLNFFSYRSISYGIIYFLLIIAFNYFYVSMQYNPIEIANNLRQHNGAIPGIRPGKPTSDFIKKVLSKITLVGAVFLGVIAIAPIITGVALPELNLAMGGTSILIVVSVALETVRTLESQMMMRHHKGFLE
jgi:preprotein translocase subunit SecY